VQLKKVGDKHYVLDFFVSAMTTILRSGASAIEWGGSLAALSRSFRVLVRRVIYPPTKPVFAGIQNVGLFSVGAGCCVGGMAGSVQ
jgi:hypothetical protein